MPPVRGRGRVLKRRTIKISKNKYKHCDIYEKPGPRGGRTVCGPTKTKKRRKK